MNVIFLLIMAITPGVAIAIFIYYKDVHEPEPVKLTLLSFIYGIFSFLICYGLTIWLNQYIELDEKNLGQQAVHAFLLVAFLEEVSKFFFVRGILYRNKNFNEPMDGIVYAVMVGMGFATAENVMYVLNGTGGTAIIRMITAIPAHAMFAILMGYYLGKAKFTQGKGLQYGLMALGVATVFHGTYDYFLFIAFVPGIVLLAFASLVIAYLLSSKAIQLHHDSSPFKPRNKQKEV